MVTATNSSIAHSKRLTRNVNTFASRSIDRLSDLTIDEARRLIPIRDLPAGA
jgi:hypothetical protein